MERDENHVALIALPCGRDRNDVVVQTENMRTAFIEYFTSKGAAGIASAVSAIEHKQTNSFVRFQFQTAPHCCVAHILPPNNLSRDLLARHAPDLLKKVDLMKAGYLFVILTNC
jgi:hypothetical protein